MSVAAPFVKLNVVGATFAPNVIVVLSVIAVIVSTAVVFANRAWPSVVSMRIMLSAPSPPAMVSAAVKEEPSVNVSAPDPPVMLISRAAAPVVIANLPVMSAALTIVTASAGLIPASVSFSSALPEALIVVIVAVTASAIAIAFLEAPTLVMLRVSTPATVNIAAADAAETTCALSVKFCVSVVPTTAAAV